MTRTVFAPPPPIPTCPGGFSTPSPTPPTLPKRDHFLSLLCSRVPSPRCGVVARRVPAACVERFVDACVSPRRAVRLRQPSARSWPGVLSGGGRPGGGHDHRRHSHVLSMLHIIFPVTEIEALLSKVTVSCPVRRSRHRLPPLNLLLVGGALELTTYHVSPGPPRKE